VARASGLWVHRRDAGATDEAMFVMDPASAPNWPTAESEINRILQRAGAKVLGLKNWGERKLAYPIGQHKRGLYVLTYFESTPDKIAGIERDVQLSEQTVRVLVLRRDEMTPELIEKALAAEPPPKVPVREEWGARGREPYGGGPGRWPAAPIEEVPEEASVVLADTEEEAGGLGEEPAGRAGDEGR
jgi:small subunit ribosomal protein S6